jgi:putative ABC transport system permease protein
MSRRPMLRVTARGLWARKRRLLGQVAAVFLGVAFLSGTLALSTTMKHAIDSSFTTANQGIDVIVRNATATSAAADAARGPIPAKLVDTVARAPGVAVAQGEVKGYGEIVGSDGTAVTGMGPRVADTWLTDPALNPWRLVAGGPPRGPEEVVVDQTSATAGKLHVGQATTVLTPEPVPVTVVGIAAYGAASGNGGSSYVGFTLAGAQEHLLHRADQVTQVVAAAGAGVGQDRLVAAVAAALPPGVQAISGSALTGEEIAAVDDAFFDAFSAFLGVFAGIALLVAALSVHNAFGVVAAARVRESALLRALGAGRGQLLRGLLGEALVLGTVGSVAGIAAGYGMAAGLEGAFAGAGLALPISGVVFTLGNAALSLVAGVLVTVVAALLPALRAARTAPVQAMRETAVDAAGTSAARIWLGLALVVAGAGLTVAVAATRAGVAALGAGALVTLVGVITVGPVLATATARVLGTPVARLRGVPGRLAGRNVERNPKRTAATASALLVGVAVVTLFTVFGGSLRASTGANLAQTFHGDLVVTPAGRGYGGAGFSPDAAHAIAGAPGVAVAAPTGTATVLVGGASVRLTVADLAQLDRLFTLDAPADGLAVSSTAAQQHGWHAGDTVPVTFADGATSRLRIGRVYQPITPLGDAVLPREAWAPHATQPLVSGVYLGLAPDADPAATTTAVNAIASRYGGLTVRDRAAYIDAETGMVSTILNIVYVMLALAIVIALLGIGNTLALAVYERTREIGLVRAVGAARAQVRATIRWEAVLTAVLGTGTGAALGLFLGWAFVRSSSGRAEIDTIAVPWLQLVIIVLAGAAAGLLAGTRPARRAARLDPLAAIATE